MDMYGFQEEAGVRIVAHRLWLDRWLYTVGFRLRGN